MTKGLLLAAGLLATSTLLACASDPHKDANDAHNAELKSERKQAQNEADIRGSLEVRAAENNRESTAASAPGSKAERERTEADAKFAETREVARSKAKERLSKLDAKVTELKALMDKAGAKATTASHDSMKTVEVQRQQVSQELDQLLAVPSESFKQANESLDARLDELEGIVKKTSNEVDKFKKK